MVNTLEIFKSDQFGEIRTITNESGDPLFCLADVCKALELTNPSTVKNRLDKVDVQVIDLHALKQTEGIVGNSMANFITENGFYDVLLYSDAPQVKPFRKWVTSEILPSIRKHGGYLTPAKVEEALLNPDVLIQLATNLKEERLKRIAAEAKVQEEAPRVLFSKAVETSKKSCLIGELAKIIKQNGIDMGEKRLFGWLRDHGYLGCKGGYRNRPTQRSMELGLFEIKKTIITKPTGEVLVTITPKVTGKGQIYFINKFLNDHENIN